MLKRNNPKREKAVMITFVKKNKWRIIGTILGALAGYLYWRFVGCSSGSCPITSNPYLTMIWFAAFVLLVTSPNKCGTKCATKR